MPSEHKSRIKFGEEVLVDVPLPPGWTALINSDGEVGVSGPCPKCLGAAYGPSVPVAGVQVAGLRTLKRSALATSSRQILASCACGFAHGEVDGSSCGRSWLVGFRQDEVTTNE